MHFSQVQQYSLIPLPKYLFGHQTLKYVIKVPLGAGMPTRKQKDV